MNDCSKFNVDIKELKTENFKNDLTGDETLKKTF